MTSPRTVQYGLIKYLFPNVGGQKFMTKTDLHEIGKNSQMFPKRKTEWIAVSVNKTVVFQPEIN